MTVKSNAPIIEMAMAVWVASETARSSFAPKYCAILTVAPEEIPVKKPMIKVVIMAGAPPTADNASLPTNCPTKAASTVVNKRHQEHFEELKKRENENLEKKTAICEAVEAIEYDKLTAYAAWNEKTQEIISLQEQWKTITIRIITI